MFKEYRFAIALGMLFSAAGMALTSFAITNLNHRLEVIEMDRLFGYKPHGKKITDLDPNFFESDLDESDNETKTE